MPPVYVEIITPQNTWPHLEDRTFSQLIQIMEFPFSTL